MYEILLPAKGSSVAITGGVVLPRPLSDTYAASKCYDGGDGYCASCAIKESSYYCLGQPALRLEFAATALHSVAITNQLDYTYLANFNLRWKGEDDSWNVCNGSPYDLLPTLGPHAFACFTGGKKAVAIEVAKIDSTNNAKIRLNEVVVYSSDFVIIQNVAPNALTGSLSGSGYGTASRDFLARACNVYGCGESRVASTRQPGAPSAGSIAVESADRVVFVLAAPIDDGGDSVLQHKVYTEWPMPKAADKITITGGELKGGAAGVGGTSMLNVVQWCYNGIYNAGGVCKSLSSTQAWMRLRFAPTFLHSVEIQAKTAGDAAKIGTFDLRYLGADELWYTCPGSPYTHPSTELLKTYTCPSEQKATSVELQQQNERIFGSSS